jgi:hypothetical protein
MIWTTTVENEYKRGNTHKGLNEGENEREREKRKIERDEDSRRKEQ